MTKIHESHQAELNRLVAKQKLLNRVWKRGHNAQDTAEASDVAQYVGQHGATESELMRAWNAGYYSPAEKR